VAGLLTAVAVLLVAIAVGSTGAAWTFRDQRDEIANNLIEIKESRAEARKELFGALKAQARAGRFSRKEGQRFDSLDALDKAAKIGRELRLPPEDFEPLRDAAIACLALPDLKPTGRVIPKPPGVIGVAFDAAMTRYALRSRDGTISVRRVADNQEIARFQAKGDREIRVFRFSPDGRYLATTQGQNGPLTVWDIDRRAVALNDPVPVSDWAAHFSPDSRRIAVGHHYREIVVYDLATGQPIRRWREPGVVDLAFRGDGSQIAAVGREPDKPMCWIVDAESGQLVRSIPVPVGGWGVAWSPDGASLATPGSDSRIYLWDAATGTRGAILEGSAMSGLIAAFHPAGTVLASNGFEYRLRLWDPVLGRPWLSVVSGQGPEFSRDGHLIIGRDDKLIEYQVDPALEYRSLAHASSSPIE
jgi:hypothetical protein